MGFHAELQQPGIPIEPRQDENASDGNGAISLQDAISKQLGLKLEKRRCPVSVLVIDHIEEKPAAN